MRFAIWKMEITYFRIIVKRFERAMCKLQFKMQISTNCFNQSLIELYCQNDYEFYFNGCDLFNDAHDAAHSHIVFHFITFSFTDIYSKCRIVITRNEC